MQVQKPQNLQRRNWPDKGYVLASENDKSLWSYLEASFIRDGYDIRDGYEVLSPGQIKEGDDID